MPLDNTSVPPFPRSPLVANDPNGTKLLEDAMADRARVRHLQCDLLETTAIVPVAGAPVVSISACYPVANVAALAVLDTTALGDGAIVGMLSVRAPWQLRRASASAPDGITIVAAANLGGRWVRLEAPSAEWLAQAGWCVDQAAGDDEALGLSPLTALATVDEVWRRTGGNPATNSVLTIVGTYVGDIVLRSTGTGPFTIAGQVSAPLYSGSITALTTWTIAGTVRQLVTDAALPVSWTASALVGKRCVLTSGVNAGAWAPIMIDLGAKQALVGVFWDATAYAAISPVLGDTFDVVDLTEVQGSLDVCVAGYAIAMNIRFVSPSFDVFAHGGYLQLAGCELRGLYAGSASRGGVASVEGCYIAPTNPYAFDSGTGGEVALYGCSFLACGISAHGGALSIAGWTVIVGGTRALFVDNGGWFRVESGIWLAVLDCISGAGSTVVVQETSDCVVSSNIWGSGNTGAHFYSVTGRSGIAADAIALLSTLAGAVTAGETILGSTALAYVALPAIDATTGNAIVLTA